MNVRITQRTAFLTLAPSRSTAFNGRKACSNRFTRIARKIQASLDLTEDMERIVSRRYVVTSTLVIGQLTRALPAKAVMGMTAGRVPGFAKADTNGFRVYTRPEAKSGGHGVGWSEITPYSFQANESWRETPVSIADPAGTEIDAKFVSDSDGELKIILAPILRFSDKGDLDTIDIKELVSLNAFIKGFGPELLGNPIQDENILSAEEIQVKDRTYYIYELANHSLVSATTWNKRVYICAITCNSLQWRKSKSNNISVLKSFQVLVSG